MNNTTEKPAGNLSDYAYAQIETAIIHGKLDFGEPLSENGLAQALKISRAPIRTALSELKIKGLVEIIPQSGCYVVNPSNESIEQLLEFRSLLETRALVLAMENNPEQLIENLSFLLEQMLDAFKHHDWKECQIKDAAFHRCLFDYAGNDFLSKSYDSLAPLVTALMFRFLRTQAEKNKSYADHGEILTLLKARRVTAAEKLLAKHIDRTKMTHANQSWPKGRSRRKDYSFRNYEEIFQS
ncbi:GntR family transcriptional regulator [Kiloniella laminariae]|uniref:GntR family transcriptional regulator n=1 Tax=Kiloniella laminariae TaxID=454162 RepID=A0ABT4LML7_9PROT|nr:GntR family transcriptional regulator [Kiloniella laminariae]MCZ4282380.1 GntR family transcriptional regulator [Kiloniella laminariae]